MSGENESSIDEHLTKINELLVKYDNELGMSNLNGNPDEVQRILSLDRAEITKMSREACGECAFVLSQYSLFVQKEFNRENAVLEWVETNLSNVTGKYMGQYSGATLDERKSSVIAENTYARDLFKIRNRVRLKTTNINFLSNKISFMSQVLLAVQSNKKD
jgi:hypothetical protein